MSAPLLIIAAGGTGGHMFPAQALAEEMLARGWRVKLSTDVRGAQYAGGFPEAVERQVVGAASPSQGGLGAKLKMPFRIIGGTIAAMRAMRRDRPACVIGFGGYPAFPAMAAAWLLKLPRLIHEQNGVLGRVNAVFATRVDAVACGTWPTKLPAGVTGQHVGNPVRASVRVKAGSPYISPGDWPMELVVFGGSQGASVMSVVPKALALVAPKYRARLAITHQAREFDKRMMTEAYADLGLRADIASFFDDIPQRMARAQLVICRAGASSVADLSVIGRPSILIPLAAAIRDEQTANAAGLVAAGAAIMVAEADLTPEVLAGHITAILRAPKKTAKMAAAALATGIPDAAERLADLVEATAKKEPKT